MKGWKSHSLFISFKCTVAENIYLFIISECHLRIIFSIIELSHSLLISSGVVNGSEVIVIQRKPRESPRKHIVNQQMIRVIALMIPFHKFYRLDSEPWEIKPSKCVNNWREVILSGFSHYTVLCECAAIG